MSRKRGRRGRGKSGGGHFVKSQTALMPTAVAKPSSTTTTTTTTTSSHD